MSALACAKVQGQSIISSMKFGSFSSSLSHSIHFAVAHAAGLFLKSSPRCQANACAGLQMDGVLLQGKKKSQKTDLIAETQSFGVNNYEVFYALQVVFWL